MMGSMDGAGVEEGGRFDAGMVKKGHERGRGGTRHGRSEGKEETSGGVREGGSNGARERSKGGAREEGNK